MRHLALASDDDGTLSHDGGVRDETLKAVERLLHSGRRSIPVTGRVLPELLEVFPRLDLCERVIAEMARSLQSGNAGEAGTRGSPS